MLAALGTPFALKRLVLVFWAAYLGLVLLTNAFDALKALEVLGDGWAFASGNWPFLDRTTGVYATPGWIDALLFGAVIAWEGLACALFAIAAARVRGEGDDLRPAWRAFAVAAALWAAFVVMTEVFLAYETGAVHVRLLMLTLVSALVVGLLPDRR